MLFLGQNKNTAQKLYEKNLELVVKNKTLLLLEKLYHTSVLTLSPREMAHEVSCVIQKDLNLEFAQIFQLNGKDDSLSSFGFCPSERFDKTLKESGISLENVKISNISKNTLVSRLFKNQDYEVAYNLESIFGGNISKENLFLLITKSYIKMVLLVPLKIGEEAMGMLLLGFNREYDSLNSFEQESMKSFIYPIGLILYKAYLYKDLQDSYSVEKKAKEDVSKAYEIEKRAKKDLEKLDKIKSQFMLATQHHLRTPLTSMRGYIDLLLGGTYGTISKKAKEALLKLQQSANNELKIVEELLNISQFQLGKDVVALVPNMDIEEIIDDTLNGVRGEAEAKKLYINLLKDKSIPKVIADASKLQVALTNIVDNAVKYTEKGGITIQLKKGGVSVKGGENKITIIISDTGVGIPKDDIEGIFGRIFERGDDAQKLFTTGRGIGLYLAARVIEAHRGKIWVASPSDYKDIKGKGKDYGPGSDFYIELPVGYDGLSDGGSFGIIH